MKKIVLSLCLVSYLFAGNSDYIPFSKISDNKKKEYHFIKTEKKKSLKSKTSKTKIEKEIKTSNIKQNKTAFIDEVKKEKIEYKRDILVSVEAEVAFFNTDISSNSLNDSNSAISFTPKIELIDKKHKFKAEVFTVSNDFNNRSIDTRWYKLGYMYNYKNANLGFNVNRLVISSLSDVQEFFPSIEFDLENKINKFALNYGASYGANSDIDNAYEYFLNLAYDKKFERNTTSFILGFKNKNIKIKDVKLEYSGPYIAVNTKF